MCVWEGDEKRSDLQLMKGKPVHSFASSFKKKKLKGELKTERSIMADTFPKYTDWKSLTAK